MKRRLFFARGDTFPHKEAFTSWAWHWNAKLRAYVNDHANDRDDFSVRRFVGLKGVKITSKVIDENNVDLY